MPHWGPFGLTGKVAAVTGSAQGIGFGIAKWLLRAGASVLVCDLQGDAAAEAVDRLSSESDRVACLQVDVTDRSAGAQIVQACLSKFGGIDILVNNAAIFPTVRMLDMSAELFAKVLDINVIGMALCTKAAGQRMIEQGRGGRIINIASKAAFRPSSVGLAAYDASKAGVVAFTKSLCLELGPHGITVNAVAPGSIDSDGNRNLHEGSSPEVAALVQQRREASKRIPVGRRGTPEDIAKTVVFLASSAADYVSGETVLVDGGGILI